MNPNIPIDTLLLCDKCAPSNKTGLIQVSGLIGPDIHCSNPRHAIQPQDLTFPRNIYGVPLPDEITSISANQDMQNEQDKQDQQKKLEEILDIISHDITNPTKWKWIFNAAFLDNTVEFFKFIKRPNEYLQIELL